MDKATKEAIIKEYARHEGDTGSPEVRRSAGPRCINHLNEHLKTHAKDHHSHRGLLLMVGQRRSMLEYLKRIDIERYRALVRSWVCASNSSASFTKRALSQMTVVWETVFVAPSLAAFFVLYETKPNAEVGFVYQAARVRV